MRTGYPDARPMLLRILLSLTLTQASGDPAVSEDRIDPQGVWLYAWTGSSSGTSWLSIQGLGEDRYRVADLRGNGFELQVDEKGDLVIAGPKGNGGSGFFSDGRRAFWDHTPAGNPEARRYGFLLRAPGTGPDVAPPTGEMRPVSGRRSIAGTWQAAGHEISPTTGALVRERSLTCTIEVRGSRIRVSFADGGFDQGVFLAPDLFWFHVVHPPVPEVDPALDGAMVTTRNHDLLGWGRVVDEAIELELFLETRGAVGRRVQLLYRYRLER